MSKQKSLLNFFAPLKDQSNLNSSNVGRKRASTSSTATTSSTKLSKKDESAGAERAVNPRLLKLEKLSDGLITGFNSSWLPVIGREFDKDYFKQLSTFLATERKNYTIFPPAHDVFSWTRACKPSDVKVVILGQDPYHGPNQAHGLCFSVTRGVTTPPSLVNMYKELETDSCGFKNPGHGYLMGWAEQGVLLLNAVLTVRQANANSHKDKGWETFTDAVISYISDKMSDVVFILWGSYAQKKGKVINTKNHCVLKGVHPSPLSAHRGFFGCKHFSQANAYLKSKGKSEIDWNQLPIDG